MQIFRYYKPIDYNFEALLKNKLYGVLPSSFNDPFDSATTYSIESIYDSMIGNKAFIYYCCEKLIDKSRNDFASPEEFDAYYNLFVDHITTHKYKREVFRILETLCREVIDCVRDSHIVCCFSKTNSCELMWAHYADSGRGFLVEYDTKELYNLVLRYYSQNWMFNMLGKEPHVTFGLRKVDYSPERIDGTPLIRAIIKKLLTRKYRDKRISQVIDFDFLYNDISWGEDIKQILKAILLKKNKLWEYEEEYRLILPKPNAAIEHIMDFDLSDSVTGFKKIPYREIGNIKPKSLYMGEKTIDSYRLLLTTIASKQTVPIFSAKVTYLRKEYGIDFNSEIE